MKGYFVCGLTTHYSRRQELVGAVETLYHCLLSAGTVVCSNNSLMKAIALIFFF